MPELANYEIYKITCDLLDHRLQCSSIERNVDKLVTYKIVGKEELPHKVLQQLERGKSYKITFTAVNSKTREIIWNDTISVGFSDLYFFPAYLNNRWLIKVVQNWE